MKLPAQLAAVALAFAACLPAQTAAPELAYDAPADFLKLPDHIHLGEVPGVATNSKGSIFVYTRTGGAEATLGGSRTFTHGGSRLFEFDRSGKFTREIGEGVYAFLFAQAVRVDAADNIWIVDRASNMVVEFSPRGRVLMTLGRKPEAVSDAGRGGGRGTGGGAGVPGDNFNRPADVAFDSAGNIYVADGNANPRIARFDSSGRFLKAWSAPNSAVSLAIDAHDNLYVADRAGRRIQVFGPDGLLKRQIDGIGAPAAICISPGPHQYLYSSNSNDPANLDDGEIYRLELDGRILGRFGSAGKLPKQFGTVNALDCRDPNTLFAAEVLNWRVQKIMLKP